MKVLNKALALLLCCTLLLLPVAAQAAEVGESISLIPGPPAGPSYLMTTTSPLTIFPPYIAAIASSSLS